MVPEIEKLLGANPFVTTGIMATVGGMFWQKIKAFPTTVQNKFWRMFSSTIEIRDGHYDFLEIRHWTQTLKPIFKNRNFHLPRGYRIVPGEGTNWYHVDKFWFAISVVTEKDEKGRVSGTKLLLRVMGKDPEACTQLIQKMRDDIDNTRNTNLLKIAVQNGTSYSTLFREKRNSKTIFHEVYDPMKRDLQKFLVSKKWYQERGIPYHRGYLLHGPPGTGKTSIIKTITGELGLDLYVVKSIDSLTGFLTNLNPGLKAIVMEDVDRDFEVGAKMTKAATGEVDKDGTGVLFKLSEFLNAIDGIIDNDGCIFFFTANNPEYLPQALMRPGRIDKHYEVGFLRATDIEDYINLFTTEGADELKNELLPQAGKITGAQVQLRIMQFLEGKES